ncbi:hypothetical protein Pflav_090020 [Phytohabitans flavus]|uniref:CBM6 domain-containing protein n=1 Tax=Phytohabitans flavus TaxID=1076124 RepID=A0A6F8Y903_9ACTN|nr:hypothetical protein Pflav_090020 [Phytohabitans flavus]
MATRGECGADVVVTDHRRALTLRGGRGAAPATPAGRGGSLQAGRAKSVADPLPYPHPRVVRGGGARQSPEGRTAPRELAGASGGTVVGWVGEGRDNTLEFTGVTVATDGRYEVTVHYVTSDRRTAAVEVNGGFAQFLEFPATGSWDRIGSVKVTLTLRAGANTIEFGNRRNWAPDFDRLTLTG